MSIVTVTPTSLPTKLAPFTGVNNGTSRLLKAISQFELNSLSEGDVVYVKSVRDYWKWLPASTLTDDSATEVTICAPTVVGAGAGRFERLNIASPDWVTSTYGGSVPVVIDAAVSLGTTSNENDGTTAATALRTDTERQRRFGTTFLTQTEYHIRFISNVPASQEVVIIDTQQIGCTIFLHGSMTDRAGQSTIFSGTTGTVTTENYSAGAGGQPLDIISASIPASWTASGTLNQRLRWTSGANTDGISWPIKDLGGAAPNAKARFAEPQASVAMTVPFASSTSTFTPVAGTTFVVESLTVIPVLVIRTIGGAGSAAGIAIVIDSLDIGNGGRVSLLTDRTVARWGCKLNAHLTTVVSSNLTDMGCQYTSSLLPRALGWTIANCYSTLNLAFICLVSGTVTRYIGQGTNANVIWTSLGNGDGTFNFGWVIISCGIWDNNAGNPIAISGNVTLQSTANLWGNGNVGGGAAAILLLRDASLRYHANSTALPNSYFLMLTATSGAENGAYIATFENANASRANVPAYDDTTQLFTANRLLSQANLQATVAAGGFGGYFFDPVTNTSMGQV